MMHARRDLGGYFGIFAFLAAGIWHPLACPRPVARTSTSPCFTTQKRLLHTNMCVLRRHDQVCGGQAAGTDRPNANAKLLAFVDLAEGTVAATN